MSKLIKWYPSEKISVSWDDYSQYIVISTQLYIETTILSIKFSYNFFSKHHHEIISRNIPKAFEPWLFKAPVTSYRDRCPRLIRRHLGQGHLLKQRQGLGECTALRLHGNRPWGVSMAMRGTASSLDAFLLGKIPEMDRDWGVSYDFGKLRIDIKNQNL